MRIPYINGQKRRAVLLLVLLLSVLIAGCEIIATEAMSRLMLSRVRFHGQVVDQHGVSVAGAEVRVTMSGNGLVPGDGGGSYTTDAEGRFVIKGRGENFGIRSIEHPQVSKFLDVNGRSAFFVPYEAEARAGATGNWQDHQKATHPYVFRVWRVERFGKVYVNNSPVGVPPDNRFYTYFVEDARYSGSGNIKEGEKRWVRAEQPGVQAGGVLAVRCFRGSDGNGDPVVWRSDASWQMTFRAIGGGIRFIPEGEVYLNEAPEAGYQQEISFGYQAGSEDYQRGIKNKQKLYIKAQQGGVYASLEIDMEPFGKNECSSVGDLKYTLDGSRSLAVPQ